MPWATPYYPDCPPNATKKEQKVWWEGFRTQQNNFAEKFNRDWLNRMCGRKIQLVPSYEETVAKMSKPNKKERENE